MIETNTLQDILVAKLRNSGFGVTRTAYRSTFNEILECGNIQSQITKQLVGQSAWQEMQSLSYFADPEYEFKRILGFGYCFTEYIVTGIDLPGSKAREILELGALANFIVSVYDHFLDNNLIPGELPVSQLVASIENGHAAGTHLNSASMRFFENIVHNYLSRVYALANYDNNNRVWKTITGAITSMYHANKILLSKSFTGSPHGLLTQKAALPIVVMGLPAWLAAIGKTDRSYFRHLRWMYALGEFLAWIDDASDLQEDEESAVPNLVGYELAAGQSSFNAIASKIAAKGSAVDKAWKLRTGHNKKNDQGLLPVCVISWLGAHYA